MDDILYFEILAHNRGRRILREIDVVGTYRIYHRNDANTYLLTITVTKKL